jgi:hypothetical protein
MATLNQRVVALAIQAPQSRRPEKPGLFFITLWCWSCNSCESATVNCGSLSQSPPSPDQ